MDGMECSSYMIARDQGGQGHVSMSSEGMYRRGDPQRANDKENMVEGRGWGLRGVEIVGNYI